MQINSQTFNSHKIWFYSARQYKWKIRIDLYNQQRCVGHILFMKKEYPIPDNYIESKKVNLYYPEIDFNYIFNILTDYKLLSIQYSKANGIGSISNP